MTDEEIKALILKQSKQVQADMFHLRYDPRKRFETKAWQYPASDKQMAYIRHLAHNNPITWERLSLVIESLWGEWTGADAAFAINAMTTPIIDWLESSVKSYRKDVSHALAVAGPEFCAGVLDSISRQMREMADDLQHVRYHVLDEREAHGQSISACFELIDNLDSEAVADSIETKPSESDDDSQW